MTAIIYDTANGPNVAHINLTAITPAETETEFIDRMTAEIVPSGARHFVCAAEALPSGPPEQWAVDWTARTINGDSAKALAAAKARARRLVAEQAKSMRVAIAETDDPIRVAAWANKASIARRVASGLTVSAAEQQSIATEAAARGRGETVAQLVDKILHWADADTVAAALADGLQKSAEAAIDAATSLEMLAATLATIEAQVTQHFAAVMAGRAAA